MVCMHALVAVLLRKGLCNHVHNINHMHSVHFQSLHIVYKFHDYFKHISLMNLCTCAYNTFRCKSDLIVFNRAQACHAEKLTPSPT